MPRELVCVLSPAAWMPAPYDALPYGPKALSFAHPNEVALPLRDGARFVIVGEPSEVAEIVYTLKPRLHDPEAGPPFVLTDELYVYEAALLARDRHPADAFLSALDVFDSRQLAALEYWIGRRNPPARKVWGNCGRLLWKPTRSGIGGSVGSLPKS